MPGNRDVPVLGPWADADLLGTASAYAGDGSDDELDSVPRFSRSVGRLALKRLRDAHMRRDAIAVFLLHPSAPDGFSTTREPMLGDGSVEVCGKIWFINETAQSGRSLTPNDEGDGALFDEVEKLGFGDVPAIVLNPKSMPPTIRIYRSGLGDEADCESLEVVDREIGIDDIRRIINLMSDNNLCTPDAQISGASMWAEPAAFKATSNAEAIAHLQVKTALLVGLFPCDVRHEQRMRAGRVDLEISQRLSNGSILVAAEIEIKVLRERNARGRRWSDAFNEKWMRRGVRQAAAYRDDRGAKGGLLCCFDMRDGDRGEVSTFDTIRKFADERGITLHRNFLYNDAEAWRRAKYGD